LKIKNKKKKRKMLLLLLFFVMTSVVAELTVVFQDYVGQVDGRTWIGIRLPERGHEGGMIESVKWCRSLTRNSDNPVNIGACDRGMGNMQMGFLHGGGVARSRIVRIPGDSNFFYVDPETLGGWTTEYQQNIVTQVKFDATHSMRFVLRFNPFFPLTPPTTKTTTTTTTESSTTSIVTDTTTTSTTEATTTTSSVTSTTTPVAAPIVEEEKIQVTTAVVAKSSSSSWQTVFIIFGVGVALNVVILLVVMYLKRRRRKAALDYVPVYEFSSSSSQETNHVKTLLSLGTGARAFW
jgi:hypothetical protein